MMGFNRLKIFDSKTGERYLNLYAFDIQNGWNERCSGMYGLPDLDPTNEGLYLYQHADIPPMKLGSNDPTFWHGADHLSIMKAICSVDVDMKMMWDKCAYFLVDHLKEAAIVLITEERVVDPTELWLGRTVMQAYEISKKVQRPIVPIIAPMHDDTLMKGIPQLHQILGLDRANSKFPRLFMINGRDGMAVEYPHELDEDLLPGEVLVLWARRTLLYQDHRYVKE